MIMKGLKQRLKRPTTNNSLQKDGLWTHQDQRIWQAVAGNHPAKVAIKLSKHPDVDVNRICPNVGYSVVHYAAAKGLDDCLNILLANRADASSCDITGATPLHAASRYGHKGTTNKLLASRSVNVNLSDKNQCTALHFAAFEGFSECVCLIADSLDVNLDSTDKDGRTPLMVAAAMGRFDVCKELVERGCNLHHKDTALGHTALTLAADAGHGEVVRLLCENGASYTEGLFDGRSALDLAKHKNRRSVIDAIHVVQLTDAANRSTNGPRLSVSSNKYKSDDSSLKKRHSVDSILDKQPQAFMDDLVAGTHLSTGSRTPKGTRRHKEDKKQSKSNMARVKAAVVDKMKTGSRRGSDASGLSSTSTPRQKVKKDSKASPASANVLPLYTNEGDPHFYEKEIKFYDSNSSLDVSSTCSAMNNLSKSMDSLKPTPEELDTEIDGTATLTHRSPKVEGTDFSTKPVGYDQSHIDKLTNEYEQKIHALEEKLSHANEVAVTTDKLQKKNSQLKKVNSEYEHKIQELEKDMSHAHEVAVATEKLQKNSEEVRNAQIVATKEEFEKNEIKFKEEIQNQNQLLEKFEKQNRELLNRLKQTQQTSVTIEGLNEQLKENEEKFATLEDENKNLVTKIQESEAKSKKLQKDLEKEKQNESAIITQAKEKIIEAERRCNQAEQKYEEEKELREKAETRVNEAESKCNEVEQKISETSLNCSDAEKKNIEVEQKCIQLEKELNEVKQQRHETEVKLGEITSDKRKVEREAFMDDLVAGTHLSTGSRTPKGTRRHKEDKKQSKSNMARVKAAVVDKMKTGSRRGSDASGLSSTSTPRQKVKKDSKASPASANVLPLYTNEGDPHFYEKEIKFYDSNSSLDVSSTCSAMNNLSKSMDSLKPTPEELDTEIDGTATLTHRSPKVEGTDFSTKPVGYDQSHIDKLTNEYEQKIHALEEKLSHANEVAVTTDKLQKKNSQLKKVNSEYEHKIQELEKDMSHAHEVAVATEKLQKNSEEVRNAQIVATKEEFEKNEIKFKEEIQNQNQLLEKFEKQNRELLNRLKQTQQTSVTIEGLNEQLKENEEKFATLEDENKNLVTKIQESEAKSKKLQKDLEKEKQNESAIITQAKEKIIEAERRCNQAEQKYEEEKELREKAETRVNEAESKCNEVEQKISETSLNCSDAEKKNIEVEQKCIQLEKELNEVKQQRHETEVKLGEITSDKRKVERELKKLKESSKKDKGESKKIKDEISFIVEILKNAEGLSLDNDDDRIENISDVKKAISKLIEKLKVEEGQLNNSEAKKKDLEDKLNTSIDEKNKQITDLEKRAKEAEDTLARKIAECGRLDSELKHTKSRLSTTNAEKAKLEEDLGTELTRTRAQLAEFEVVKVSDAEDISRSKDEATELRQKLDEALSALERQREDSISRDVYEADCAKIKQDANVLKKEIKKTLERFAQMQLEIANKEQEISDLRVERNQSEAKSSKNESDVALLKSKCHESDVQVNILRQQLTDTKHKLEKATEEIESLRKSRRDMTIRLTAKQSEINETEKKKIENLKKQLDNLSSHLQESEKQYKETISIYRGHLLAAISGQLDNDVQSALQEIIKLRVKDEITHT